jgi:alpha-tubulin suppressor-like RCC1 family protein
MSSKKVAQIAAGWNHSLALTESGDLYACGYGAHGQLGLGDKESKTQFTLVSQMQNKSITSIFAGGSHSWVVLNHMNPTREIPSPIVE